VNPGRIDKLIEESGQEEGVWRKHEKKNEPNINSTINHLFLNKTKQTNRI